MIVGSVLLVIGAGLLLGLGLVRLDAPLLYSSIGVSVVAAFTLVVGVRRLAAVRAGRGVITVKPVVASGGTSTRPVGRATPRPVGRATVSPPAGGVRPAPADASTSVDVTVPPGEPAAESVAAADLAWVGHLDTEVVVVDGRPRFHLAECLHLLGLESESLSAAQAIEVGFTPCGRCRPVAALRSLAEVGDPGARSA